MKNGEYEVRDIVGGKALVVSPYNPDFVARVKAMGGRWNPSERAWSVNSAALDDVRAAMMEIYGQTDEVSSDTVTAVVTFGQQQQELRNAYRLFGRIVASAFGRDSGAHVGDGVSFVSGAPESGGSSKNWATVIPAGCVVKMYDVPRWIVERDLDNLPDGVAVQVEQPASAGREALMAERARLMARIAEIDAALGKE